MAVDSHDSHDSHEPADRHEPGDLPREELLAVLGEEVRLTQNATDEVDEALTRWLGVNRTDSRSLDVVERRGRVTAGQLADEAQLTSGSVTAMVDRLEKSGILRRVRDEKDRRRVFIEMTDDARAASEFAFADMVTEGSEALSAYGDDELRTVIRFLRDSRALQQAQAQRVRALAPWREALPEHLDVTLPVDGTTRGTLRFPGGASHVTLTADPSVPGLFRAEFHGRVPAVEQDGGEVTVRYPRFTGLRRRGRGEVRLSTSVPWGLVFGRGLAHVDADLRGLVLERVELRGGAGHVHLTLPAPRGVVPLRLTGGVSDVSLETPRGTAVRVRINGGASHLRVGDQSFGALGGAIELGTGDVDAPDRYELELRGGASHLSVG